MCQNAVWASAGVWWSSAVYQDGVGSPWEQDSSDGRGQSNAVRWVAAQGSDWGSTEWDFYPVRRTGHRQNDNHQYDYSLFWAGGNGYISGGANRQGSEAHDRGNWIWGKNNSSLIGAQWQYVRWQAGGSTFWEEWTESTRSRCHHYWWDVDGGHSFIPVTAKGDRARYEAGDGWWQEPAPVCWSGTGFEGLDGESVYCYCGVVKNFPAGWWERHCSECTFY